MPTLHPSSAGPSELAVIPKETALQVFTAQDGMQPYLAKIRAEIDAFKPDLTTVAGRTAIASIAYKVAKSKTYLDSVGKELADAQKEIPKKIDASRKLVRDTLDSWKDEVRKPLTDWEQAEETRVAGLNQRLAALTGIVPMQDDTSANLAAKLEQINGIAVDDSWQEFKAKAVEAKGAAQLVLVDTHRTALQRESEAAELVRLRAEAAERMRRENEERIAKEAADKARAEAEASAKAAAEKAEREARERLEAAERTAKEQREAAERKAKQEKEAAAKREADLKAAQEKAEREKLEAEQRAVKAEKEATAKAAREHAAKLAAEAEEAKQREANKAHKTKINRAALDALVAGGMNEEAAKLAITLIASKKIPAVTITY